MNIKKAKEDIKNTVRAYLDKDEFGQYRIPEVRQRPILLMGPPGIGKTQIMQQIARECDIGLIAYTITHHTRQSAVGLPFIKEEVFEGKTHSVTEYTMSEIISSIYRYMEETGKREGILFIDEINCVSETLAPTMLQFLQCKTFGNQAVPKGWIITAAGNPPEYNKSVRDFDFVTLDRVRKINIEADLEAFRSYARTRHIHPFILSYLELRPQNFYRTENDVDGMQFVTARGWEDLSYLIYSYEKLSIPVDEDVIHQFLQHEDIAKDVAAYYDLYQKYKQDYRVQKILSGEDDGEVRSRAKKAGFDERISLIGLLLDAIQGEIRENVEREDMLRKLLLTLKNLKIHLGEVAQWDEQTVLNILRSDWESLQQMLSREDEANAIRPAERREYQQVIDILQADAKEIRLAGVYRPQDAFALIKERFDREVGEMKSHREQIGGKLVFVLCCGASSDLKDICQPGVSAVHSGTGSCVACGYEINL